MRFASGCLFALAAGLLGQTPPAVLTGLDVLTCEGLRPLEGKRVGVVTNHSAIGRDRRDLIRVLAESGKVKLAAIFTPEHGLEADREGYVEDSTDPVMRAPVFSLYQPERRRPTPEMLRGIDALVYDLPQHGARFLTRITTLGYTLEAAAREGIPFYVLDRPNGINGVDVAGPPLDENYVSFVGYLPGMPIRHGMTAGELALLFNGEKKLRAELHVIRMRGWKRSMWYDQTGLEWVNPSPNIRSLTQAVLYPGVCLLESRQVSVGRGTDTPFQLIGAPWYRAREVAAHLNALNLPGVRFLHRRFRPRASVYRDQECDGVEILLVNREVFDPVLLGLELLAATLKYHPGQFDLREVMPLLGNQEAADRLRRGQSGRQVLKAVRPGVEAFRKRRAKYLLYE